MAVDKAGKVNSRRDAEGWTTRERMFVREYLVDLNQTQAAIRCGYAKNSAKNRAVLLMKQPHVKAAIDLAIKARIERVDVTADRVVQELARIALADFGDTHVTTAEKKAALDSLARHLGLFKDKIDMGVEQKTELRIKFV